MKRRTMLILGVTVGVAVAFALAGCNKEDVNEMISGEDKGYKLEKQEEKNEERELMIKYPEVIELKDEELMQSMNKKLKEIIGKYDNDTYKDVFIDYEATKSDSKILSILYEGTAKMGEEKEIKIKDSVNFDMKTGSEITYENFVKDSEEVMDVLEEKLKAKDAGAELEAEGMKIYFQNDSVVFYYMPLDDEAEEFIEISVSKEEIDDYINEKYTEEKMKDEEEEEKEKEEEDDKDEESEEE